LHGRSGVPLPEYLAGLPDPVRREIGDSYLQERSGVVADSLVAPPVREG